MREFVQDYKGAKKRPRRRKVNPYIEGRVLTIRRRYHDCCGEEIVYWQKKGCIHLSRSTVYRIFNKHLQWMYQMDTVDFGELYAYTAVDIYTREAQVVMLPGLTGQDGRKALESVMAYFGSCEVLQTDGGKEFLGEFEERVGCCAGRHRMARPYHKNEQAFVESFHRTLRKECLGWGNYEVREREELQKEVEGYLECYHHERPHWASIWESLCHICRI